METVELSAKRHSLRVKEETAIVFGAESLKRDIRHLWLVCSGGRCGDGVICHPTLVFRVWPSPLWRSWGDTRLLTRGSAPMSVSWFPSHGWALDPPTGLFSGPRSFLFLELFAAGKIGNLLKVSVSLKVSEHFRKSVTRWLDLITTTVISYENLSCFHLISQVRFYASPTSE